MKPVYYYKNGLKYKKLNRDEIIMEGAMQSWCNGELQPIMNTDGKTIGSTPADFDSERDFYNLVIQPNMPDPGSDKYERMIDFMRADLESGMGYSKIIETARKNIEARGLNFDEEFEKWRKNERK